MDLHTRRTGNVDCFCLCAGFVYVCFCNTYLVILSKNSAKLQSIDFLIFFWNKKFAWVFSHLYNEKNNHEKKDSNFLKFFSFREKCKILYIDNKTVYRNVFCTRTNHYVLRITSYLQMYSSYDTFSIHNDCPSYVCVL